MHIKVTALLNKYSITVKEAYSQALKSSVRPTPIWRMVVDATKK
jgi:hypothetical protein